MSYLDFTLKLIKTNYITIIGINLLLLVLSFFIEDLNIYSYLITLCGLIAIVFNRDKIFNIKTLLMFILFFLLELLVSILIITGKNILFIIPLLYSKYQSIHLYYGMNKNESVIYPVNKDGLLTLVRSQFLPALWNSALLGLFYIITKKFDFEFNHFLVSNLTLFSFFIAEASISTIGKEEQTSKYGNLLSFKSALFFSIAVLSVLFITQGISLKFPENAKITNQLICKDYEVELTIKTNEKLNIVPINLFIAGNDIGEKLTSEIIKLDRKNQDYVITYKVDRKQTDLKLLTNLNIWYGDQKIQKTICE